MLQEQAVLAGIEIVILDEADCPAKQIGQNPKHVTGSFIDPEKIRELATKCDVLTIETEHVNTEVLKEIATKGVTVGLDEVKKVPVYPSWKILRLMRDKYRQKMFLATKGIPVAFGFSIGSEGEISIRDSLQEVAGRLGFPFLLKARKGSCNGCGVFEVECEEDFDKVISSMGELQLYAEEWISAEKQLSVLAVRTEDNDGRLRHVHTYPTVETIHEDGMCTKVLYPPRQVSEEACEEAKKVAVDVVQALFGRGIFAVEMFLLKDGRVLVNEVAPRPHESGHLFTEAMPYMSQFKAHLYSILDILPCSIELRPREPAAIMLNILGGAHENSHDSLVDLADLLYDDSMDIALHLYGKPHKPGCKIGHITATAYIPSVNLEQRIVPLIREIDRIRQDRLKATSAQLHTSDAPSTLQPSPAPSTSSRDTKSLLVVVTMGTDSDLPILKPAFEILEHFRIPYDFTITSTHHTPHRVIELGRTAAQRGIRVLIAAAGGATHLPGMLASETTVPVIGVPIKATHLDGHDSLLSMVQTPRGCPVATVGINNATNAALLAVKIMESSDRRYSDAMADYMKGMSDEVEAKAARLRDVGWREYLGEK